MISDVIKNNLPEWIEAGAIVSTGLVVAIAAAAVLFFRVDAIANDLSEMKTNVGLIPVILEKIEENDEDIDKLEEDVDDLEDDVKEFWKRNRVGHAKKGTV